MVSFGVEEEGDGAFFIAHQCADVVATERYPFIHSGEDVSGDERVCTWDGFGNLNDVAYTREGGEAWNIGLKVDAAEEEGDLIGSPKHLGRGM